MQKLTIKETQQVAGGSISGALLNGVGKIIESSAKGFSTVVGTINNVVHSWADKPHVKSEIKYGDTTIKTDDSKQLDFQKEVLKHEEKMAEINLRGQRLVASENHEEYIHHVQPIEVHHLAEPVYTTEMIDENHEFHAEVYQENYLL